MFDFGGILLKLAVHFDGSSANMSMTSLELLSPGAESDVVTVEGCLDDHDVDRGGVLLDDMDEALTSDLLEAGPSDLCDPHDPDLDESTRAIRYVNTPAHTHTHTEMTGCALSRLPAARPPVTTSL